MDLTLNNQQWLICHKTKRNETKPNQKHFLRKTHNDKNIIPITVNRTENIQLTLHSLSLSQHIACSRPNSNGNHGSGS